MRRQGNGDKTLNELQQVVDQEGAIPLSWAGATTDMDYLNWGDALSPVMVALMSGLPIRRVPTKSQSVRLGAVGTIGHGFDNGTIFFWGTGSSQWKNPSAPVADRVPFQFSAGTKVHVTATRGRMSKRLLGGGPDTPYGDPVWLLPRFYKPEVKKTHELGVILHLSELDGRALDAGAAESVIRARVPESLRSSIRIINTLTRIDAEGLKDKTDEILSCKRIVSTSLHGMVVAESYGIPCLYFAPRGTEPGHGFRVEPLNADWLDLRLRDLYTGIGRTRLPLYAQPRDQESDWDDVMKEIDLRWKPVTIDEQALMDAFPVKGERVVAEPGKTIWQHPAITGIQFQHDVAALRAADTERNKAKAA
ncbi:polysaccharide pyruvyl transferase family protein [Sphingobium sp. HBC34]|uniref:Polysaccharide pyruvyl transferase family protein n=1 Tax=Sphingobium cyanobacteriorum TaxID=3063954 RepID=A0ABT8ZP88_9SPHN|nr:polysaccharide pyruvyl transferase family protein [Sphingobium sp. HBC34]MDO7836017.1 polysaccharide pyruvyl transferase family protein [Sphingobium sp. HBC34]